MVKANLVKVKRENGFCGVKWSLIAACFHVIVEGNFNLIFKRKQATREGFLIFFFS